MDFDYLYIWTQNEELKSKYQELIIKHNEQVEQPNPNAGFDLLSPKEEVLFDTIGVNNNNNYHIKQTILDTEIICCMKTNLNTPLSYYLYPRSSIIKTPLRLSNSVGIIDSGYRGNIKAVFDYNTKFTIEKYSRLVQLCSPTLKPLKVILVNNLDDLGYTSRGSGGFGSTGI